MKKVLIGIISAVFLILVSILFINIYKEKQLKDNEIKKQNRYKEIKSSVNKELERYLYVVMPNCQKREGMIKHVTHEELVYNAGMDKELLLDVNEKSYCGVYVKVYCPEDGKLEWKTKISCNDYEDKGYVEWAYKFKDKK